MLVLPPPPDAKRCRTGPLTSSKGVGAALLVDEEARETATLRTRTSSADGGTTADLFWAEVGALKEGDKAKLLAFWGIPALPAAGFAGIGRSLELVIEPRPAEGGALLPRAATCFVTLRIPAASTDEEMRAFHDWAERVCGVKFKAIKDRWAAQHQLMIGFWWDSNTLTRTLEERKLELEAVDEAAAEEEREQEERQQDLLRRASANAKRQGADIRQIVLRWLGRFAGVDSGRGRPAAAYLAAGL